MPEVVRSTTTKRLSPGREEEFQEWYKKKAKKFGLDPDPDDPRHHYNYRGAFRSGRGPDKSGHWPSKYKREGHPRLFLKGRDTRK